MTRIFIKDFLSFSQSVPQILQEAGLDDKIKKQKKILLKPNLTINHPPPCTTPVEFVEEVVKFCQDNSKAEIIVAEGSGGCDTQKAFADLGFNRLSQKYKIKLVDLNRGERITVKNPKALVLKEVKLPKVIFESFFINLPVLKEHDEAIVTCAAKNLFGLYLNQKIIPSFINWWNKSELHGSISLTMTSSSLSGLRAESLSPSKGHIFGVHQSIVDLNQYVKSDFILVDASVGQKGNEITGPACQPPIKKLIAGFDNFEVDRFCAPLLGYHPDKIPYLKQN